MLAEFAGPQAVFLVLAAVAALALPFAWRLPSGRGATVRAGRPRFGLPARLDTWSFVQGFALDGIFVLGLSVLAAQAMPQGAVLAAGAALALRYAAEMVLGPPGGALAERFGALPHAGRALHRLGRGARAGRVRRALGRGDQRGAAARPAAAAAGAGGRRRASGAGARAGPGAAGDLARPRRGAGPIAAGLLLPVLAPPLLYGATGLALALAALAVAAPRTRRG